MKYLKIPIPEKKDWKRWGEILMYKLRGGFKCKHCGAKMAFKGGHLEADINGKRIILENHEQYVCPTCTVKEMNEQAERVFVHSCKCDWCNEDKKTASYTYLKDPKLFITFGSSHWNGHYICQDCLNELNFVPIRLQSSMLKQVGDRMYYTNELGLTVKPDECNFRRH